MAISPQRVRRATRRELLSTPVKVAIASALLIAALAPLSRSPLVVLAAAATLGWLIVLLWRQNEPPILLFPILFQWSVVAVKPIMSALEHSYVSDLAEFGGGLEEAAYFGFAAVASLALGARLGVGRLSEDWNAALKTDVAALPLRRMLAISLTILFGGHFLALLANLAGPLRQIFLHMSTAGLMGMFVLAYWAFLRRRAYGYLAAILVLEIVIGITGYFAAFRLPVFMLCIAAISARPKIRPGDLFIVALAATLLIGLGAFWSEVKQDYRRFASAGAGEQIVAVSLSDRLDYMANEAVTFNGPRFAEGVDLMLSRHSYIDFLGATMTYVPHTLPHENGLRLGQALLNIVMPRVLFPNKPDTEFDSEVTAKYTGLPLTIRTGTSISIGYLGELYIDFGVVGAVIATLIGGWGFGVAYRLIRDNPSTPPLIRFGLCAVFAISFCTFDTALIKLIGAMATSFISIVLLQRFVLPQVLRMTRWSRSRPGLAGVR